MTMTTTDWMQTVPAELLLVGLKGVVWLAMVVACAFLLRKSSAAARSWIWTLGLVGLLLLPALSLGAPQWAVLPLPSDPPAALETAQPVEAPRTIEAAEPGAAPDPVAPPEAVVASEPVAEPPHATAPTVPPRAEEVVHSVEPPSHTQTTASVTDRAEGAAVAGASDATPPVAGLLMALWLGGAAFMFVPLLLASTRVRRLVGTAREPARGTVTEMLDEGRRQLRIVRSVRLRYHDGLRIPVTTGELRPTILLPGEAENWPLPRVRSVLLHELAHVRRHDWLTQMLGSVARSLHWFNPLVWLAHDRQQQEAERACDDLVLAMGSRPSDYAGDLVAVARALRRSGPPALGLVAMARRPDLSDRVDSILDESTPRGWTAMRWVGWGSLAAFLIALPLASAAPARSGEAEEMVFADAVPEEAPSDGDEEESAFDAPETRETFGELPGLAFAAQGLSETTTRRPGAVPSPLPNQTPRCAYTGEGRRSTSISGENRSYRIEWELENCSVRIRMDGEMTFSADDSRIESMARDAYFELEERIGRSERRVVIEPRGGQIEYRYWEDRDEHEWDAEAQAWFRSFLPELFRNTTFNAEARVRRMLDGGGPDAVFDEVVLIHADHVAGRYLKLLMEYEDLSTDELGQVMDLAGERIDSDHQLGEILMGIARNYGLPAELRPRFLRAATTLESDHTMGRVLSFVLEDDDLPDDVLLEVLRAVERIESDHTTSEVLMGVLRDRRLTAEQRRVFLEVSSAIESDHSQGRVLGGFLDQGELTDAELADILDASRTIESDHTRGELLRTVMREHSLSGAALDSFLRSAAGIESDHTLAGTAMVVLERAELTPDQIGLLLRMTETIESDHQTTELVMELMSRDASLAEREWSALLQLTERVGSDHNRGQIVRGLLDSAELDEAQLLDVLGLIAGIGSDHQASEALIHLADTQRITGAVRDGYLRVAERIGSDRQEERALAALARAVIGGGG